MLLGFFYKRKMKDKLVNFLLTYIAGNFVQIIVLKVSV